MVTNIEVREELVNCFFEAHKEFMKKGVQQTGIKKSDEELKGDVTDLVKMAFKEANANFSSPTKQDFMNVMGILQRKARAAGRDESIIQKHAGSMIQLLQKLN